MKYLIDANDISHSFENDLFSNVTLRIKEKESIAILGVSGSGKSTLLNNLSTMLAPKNGVISLCGVNDIYSRNQDIILQLRRERIGIIFQSHYLFRGFSALENLQVTSILTKKPIDMELLKFFNIDNVLNQQIGELSGGQQQRLSIARVLTKKPDIIFADEPTGNLDKDNTNNVMKAIFAYINKYNAALVIATHDSEVADMCDKKYILENKILSLL